MRTNSKLNLYADYDQDPSGGEDETNGADESGPSEDEQPAPEAPSGGDSGGSCENRAGWCNKIDGSECYRSNDVCCAKCKTLATGPPSLKLFYSFNSLNSLLINQFSFQKHTTNPIQIVSMVTSTHIAQRWWERVQLIVTLIKSKSFAARVVLESNLTSASCTNC